MGALAAVSNKRYTFEEYLKLEENNDLRYEYYNGQVFFKDGSSFNHADICSNINFAVKSKIKYDDCRSFQVSVKVEVQKNTIYFYPDVGVTCHAGDIEDGYIIRNPLIIVEVLAPSTESYDRNEKWNAYRKLPSLKYFLFVNQQRLFVELYSRTGPDALYQYQAFDSMEDEMRFPGLAFLLSMKQIYERVRLPKVNYHQ